MGKSKGEKHKAKGAALTTQLMEEVDLPNGWMEKLLATPQADLAIILGVLANEGGISTSQIKKAGMEIDPIFFSSPKWSKPVASVPDHLKPAEFDDFSTATVLLPLSFHVTTAKVAWRIQDVIQERVDEDKKTRARVFDAVWPTLVQSFLHAHITLSTLFQLWACSKGGSLISWSAPQCQQCTLVEVGLSMR